MKISLFILLFTTASSFAGEVRFDLPKRAIDPSDLSFEMPDGQPSWCRIKIADKEICKTNHGCRTLILLSGKATSYGVTLQIDEKCFMDLDEENRLKPNPKVDHEAKGKPISHHQKQLSSKSKNNSAQPSR